MKKKIWIKYWFYTISLLVIIGVFNFIVDPYQQYRKSTFYHLAYTDSRELNSGLAKNFHFDSVILGTSMMENFHLDDIKKILGFQKPIKLTMPGSSIYEQSIMLKTAFKHQTIKNVLIGIDFFSYYGDTHRLKYGEAFFPFYLYDENIFNDYKYLISSDTTLKSFKALQHSKDKELYSYKNMYEWYWKDENQNTLASIQNRWEHKENFDNKTTNNIKKFTYLKENFEKNLKPLLEKYKNTNFILIFPPYSILAYKIYNERGYLTDFINFKIYITKSIENLKNVKVYDFEFATKITHNLNNYYDLYHYKKHITKWILQQIKKEDYQVNYSFEQSHKEKFLRNIQNYSIDIN